jgi:hypothetical protein
MGPAEAGIGAGLCEVGWRASYSRVVQSHDEPSEPERPRPRKSTIPHSFTTGAYRLNVMCPVVATCTSRFDLYEPLGMGGRYGWSVSDR